MKIAISGASGLIGSRLVERLRTDGHSLLPMKRHRSQASDGAVYWNPQENEIDASALKDVDAIVHLAGENIASGRWTQARKKAIRDSRVAGTRLVSEAMSKLESSPGILLCASAVGFYGSRGDEILTEDSDGGEGFLADVCRDWEAATQPAKEAGARVVNLRFGAVLSVDGGALTKMLPVFKLGLGGRLGAGRQFFSWVALDDAIEAMVFALNHEELSGPLNVTSPEPTQNKDFTKTLGKVLHRPTLFPAPAFALRLALGEMADEMLLASLRAVPKRLQEVGFQFHHPELMKALEHEIR